MSAASSITSGLFDMYPLGSLLACPQGVNCKKCSNDTIKNCKIRVLEKNGYIYAAFLVSGVSKTDIDVKINDSQIKVCKLYDSTPKAPPNTPVSGEQPVMHVDKSDDLLDMMSVLEIEPVLNVKLDLPKPVIPSTAVIRLYNGILYVKIKMTSVNDVSATIE